MIKKIFYKEANVMLIIVLLVLSTFVVTGYSLDINTIFSNNNGDNTLIADSQNKQIIEVDSSGTILWSYSTGLNDPMDVERLSNGNTLICDTWNDRIIEIDSSGSIIWSISTGLLRTFDAERLSNGNTLIADNNHHRVLEVDSSGTTVWQKSGLANPTDVERLSNGNTLITDCGNNRIIEVNNAGSIVWSYSSGLNHPTDAERLANGNTLIAGNNNNNVIEVDSSGTIVWSHSTGLDHPHDAERLANGNTLIADVLNNRIIEVDSSGTIVWSHSSGLNWPFDAERLANNPPDNPIINGPTSGKVDQTLTYEISAVDPDGDEVYFWIEWFQGCPGVYWQGPYESGETVEFTNTWDRSGTHIIRVKAKDTNDAESDTATLSVTIPRSKTTFNHPINDLFSRYSSLFPILRIILKELV